MVTPTKKVIEVQDEDDIRVDLSGLFQEQEFLVSCAGKGEEALRARAQESVHPSRMHARSERLLPSVLRV